MPYKDPEKQREYARRWMARRRERWFQKNGPCSRCGSWEELEIDHVDPNTKVSHRVWSWSKARRDKELAKCQVLCEDCHREKSYEDGTHNRPQHGERSMYAAHGCRCAECLQAQSEYMKKYRARKKNT